MAISKSAATTIGEKADEVAQEVDQHAEADSAPDEEEKFESAPAQPDDGKEQTRDVDPDEDEGKSHNKDLGARGEDAAAAFLERRGYNILERNFTCVAGEADIIVKDDDAIHFVEVKTRMSEKNGFPSEAVDKVKRARYEKIAEIYLCDYEGPDSAVMFDIISILVTGEHRAFLKMHRNAFGIDG